MKNELDISASRKGKTVKVRLIGRISHYKNDSERFRQIISEHKDASDVEIYIKSEGGDVFEAAEIVNIIKQFPGKVTGRGGSIVASAATYIALHCEKFTLAANSQFMIHKPHGYMGGNEDVIASRLKLLKNITADYVKAYAKRTGKSEDEVRELLKSDYWMSSKEAKEQGFIDDIDGEEEITSEDVMRIAACGAPQVPEIKVVTKSKKDMEVNPVLIGLPADATKAQIEARLVELNQADTDVKRLKQEKADAEAQAKKDRVQAMITDGVTSKLILESQRPSLTAFGESNPEGLKAFLDGIQPVQAVSKQLAPKAAAKAEHPALTDGKDYGWHLENAPEALEQFEKENPDGFEAFVNAYYK